MTTGQYVEDCGYMHVYDTPDTLHTPRVNNITVSVLHFKCITKVKEDKEKQFTWKIIKVKNTKRDQRPALLHQRELEGGKWKSTLSTIQGPTLKENLVNNMSKFFHFLKTVQDDKTSSRQSNQTSEAFKNWWVVYKLREAQTIVRELAVTFKPENLPRKFPHMIWSNMKEIPWTSRKHKTRNP